VSNSVFPRRSIATGTSVSSTRSATSNSLLRNVVRLSFSIAGGAMHVQTPARDMYRIARQSVSATSG
jgi:hypothetical protein